MRNKVFLTGIAVILLSLIVVTVPVAAPEYLIPRSWHRMDWAPEELFRHHWTGTPLGTVDGLEFWELYTELRMMMPAMVDGDDDYEWVKMTIKWDPEAQKGEIIKWEHHGMNLRFWGWEGIIEYDGVNHANNLNGVYHFQVGGQGEGFYRSDGKLYNLVIEGSFKGLYYPDSAPVSVRVIGSPLESGTTEAIERATLWYGEGRPIPVGGEIVPINSLALLAPWITLCIAIVAVSTAILLRRKLFLH